MMTAVVARWRSFLGLVMAGAVLAGCAGLIGTRQVDLPLAKLQHGLEQRFPLHHKVLAVFELELAHPQLALLPEQDRVALTLDVSASSPFLKRTLHGNLVLSGHLAVDAARNAVVLDQANVDRFDLDGLDPGKQRQLSEVVKTLADNVSKDLTLYHFRPEDLRYAGVQFVASRITVTPASVVVTVDPLH